MRATNGVPIPYKKRIQDQQPSRDVISWAKRNSALNSTLLLIVALGVAFWLKYNGLADRLTLDSDPANYLVTMNGFFGNDPTSLGLTRPPLIAIPLKIFTTLFGPLTGIKVLGVLVAVSIGIPFFLLAKQVANPYLAALCSFLFVFASGYASMLFWGFITLIGFSFGLLILYFLLQTLERPSRLKILATGLSASLLVGFHQVSTVMFLLVVVSFLFLYLLFDYKRVLPNLKVLLQVTLVALIFSAVYLPIYLQFRAHAASAVSYDAVNSSLGSFKSFQEWQNHLAFFFPDTALTVLLSVTAFLGLILLWSRNRNACLLVIALLMVTLLGSFVALDGSMVVIPNRFPYLLYAPLWLLASAAISGLVGGYRLLPNGVPLLAARIGLTGLAMVIIGVFIFLVIPLSQRSLESASNYFGYLDTPLWSSVNWIRQNTEPTATLVAHPKPYGWWIEGAAQRNTLETRDNKSFYETQSEESYIADLLLSGNQGVENGRLRIAVPHPFEGKTAIGAFLAGQYQDVLLVNDFSASREKDTQIVREGNGMVLKTSYQISGLEVVQEVELDPGESNSLITYQIRETGDAAGEFRVDLHLEVGDRVRWKQTGPTSIQKTQRIRPRGQPIVTKVTITGQGTNLNLAPKANSPNQLLARFDLKQPEASITFRVDVIKPSGGAIGPVSDFSFSRLVQEYSIDYIAVDTRVRHPLFNHLSPGSAEWLDEAPYLELAFSQKDVKVYRVKKKHLSDAGLLEARSPRPKA